MLMDALIGLNLSSFNDVTFESDEDEEDKDVAGKGGSDIDSIMSKVPMDANGKERESKVSGVKYTLAVTLPFRISLHLPLIFVYSRLHHIVAKKSWAIHNPANMTGCN